MALVNLLVLIVFAFVAWYLSQMVQQQIAKRAHRKNRVEHNQSVYRHRYEEEHEKEHAKEARPKAFGQSQSPINLISSYGPTTKLMTMSECQRNPLHLIYPQKVKNCTIINKGTTVQINIPESSKCILNTKGKAFRLLYFHFRTPSEHTIDGKPYEMEMHLVHANQDNELAVLGFIFSSKLKGKQQPKLKSNGTDSGWESDTDDRPQYKKKKRHKDSRNKFLAQFWDQLPLEKTKYDIPLKKPISFDYLFETASNNFTKNVKTDEIDINMDIFEYMGSLTTPPYTEGVNWMVSKQLHHISNKQCHKLSACWGHANNARPVQKLCGRQISLRSKSSLKVV